MRRRALADPVLEHRGGEAPELVVLLVVRTRQPQRGRGGRLGLDREVGQHVEHQRLLHQRAAERAAAAGVVLAGGEELPARVVVSCADPRRTFLDLVEPGHLDDEFLQAIRAYRSEGTSLKINLALDGLPDFRVLPGAELAPHHRTTMHICPGMEYLERAWDDAKYGSPSQGPLIEMTLPTTYDASLAPPGKRRDARKSHARDRGLLQSAHRRSVPFQRRRNHESLR